jgi:hypothetical protein
VGELASGTAAGCDTEGGVQRGEVVACAAICRSWREVTKEVVKTLEECGRITFPISLKQVSALFSDITIHVKFAG